MSNENNSTKKAILVVGAAALSFLQLQLTAAGLMIAVLATINQKSPNRCRVQNGRYRRAGALDCVEKKFWRRIDKKGDLLEFLHFTSLTRESFGNLVELCKGHIRSHGLSPSFTGQPQPCHLSRQIVKLRDTVAMALRFFLSTAEVKDLHSQFGVVATTFINAVQLGIRALIASLFHKNQNRVIWDRSIAMLQLAAEQTALFLDIPGVDGTKVKTKAPLNRMDQNCDYNGWTKDVNQKMIVVWDPFGKIVDAAVNLPGSFHDSCSAWWCNLYKYFEDVPVPFKAVCADAFYTKGNLQGKLVKTQGTHNDNCYTTPYDQSLTHLRQCSEWGNNILRDCWRQLRTKLPTNNVAQSQIMWACILLRNWRTETVGKNQIKTCFNDITTEADNHNEG